MISEYEKKYTDDKFNFIETTIYDNFICSIVENDKLYNLNSKLFYYNLDMLDNLKTIYHQNDFIFVKTTKKDAEVMFYQDLSSNKIFIPKLGLANIQESKEYEKYINNSLKISDITCPSLMYTTTGELINMPNKAKPLFMSFRDKNIKSYFQCNEKNMTTANYKINNIQLILFGLNSSSIEECENEFKSTKYNKDNIESSSSDTFKSNLFDLLKEIKTENDFLLKSNLLLNMLNDFEEKEKLDLSNNNIRTHSKPYEFLSYDNTFRKILETNDYENFKRILFEIKINFDSKNVMKLNSNKFIPYKYDIEEHLENKLGKLSKNLNQSNQSNESNKSNKSNNGWLSWFNKFSLYKINNNSESNSTHYIHLKDITIDKDLYLE